jgi:amidase
MILPEWTISDLQERMESGELTARRLAELYTERISEIDKDGPYINSVIGWAGCAEIADTLDAERGQVACATPMDSHIDRPSILDRMQTTAGRLRWLTSRERSFIVQLGGKLILGKGG